MYCPQCGQQQASTEMRFCSRCGFPMIGVVELLASGGLLTGAQDASIQQAGDSPRRMGVRQGVMMLFIGAVLVPVLGILAGSTPGNNLLELLLPLTAVICFAGGLMRILYATIFEQGASSIKAHTAADVAPMPPIAPPQLKAEARISALPPQREQPAASFFTPPRRMDTAELVQPPSVTENTTRLLDEDKPIRKD